MLFEFICFHADKSDLRSWIEINQILFFFYVRGNIYLRDQQKIPQKTGNNSLFRVNSHLSCLVHFNWILVCLESTVSFEPFNPNFFIYLTFPLGKFTFIILICAILKLMETQLLREPEPEVQLPAV